ncbi:hypothetical protein [Anaerosinus sp.]
MISEEMCLVNTFFATMATLCPLTLKNVLSLHHISISLPAERIYAKAALFLPHPNFIFPSTIV